MVMSFGACGCELHGHTIKDFEDSCESFICDSCNSKICLCFEDEED